MSNNQNIDEKNQNYWKNLSNNETDNIYSTYQAHGKYFTEITRAMSDILFNWLFILNTGGLIAVTNIFASKCVYSNNKLFFMALCFLLGLFFIYVAARLEKSRFAKKIEALDINFDLLKTNQISVGSYCKSITAEICPYYGGFIIIIEILSFVSFLTGSAIGFYILVKI